MTFRHCEVFKYLPCEYYSFRFGLSFDGAEFPVEFSIPVELECDSLCQMYFSFDLVTSVIQSPIIV